MRKILIGILVVVFGWLLWMIFGSGQQAGGQTLVFIEVPRPKLELATMEVNAIVKDDIPDNWPKDLPFVGNQFSSTSRLKLQAVYKVKLGYDLQNSPQKINVSYDSKSRQIVSVDTQNLPIRVLSCEMQPGTLSLDVENGWFNKITEDDKAAAISYLGEKARQQVSSQSGILTQAATSLESELKKILQVDVQNCAQGLN